jgi:hypothetical protein
MPACEIAVKRCSLRLVAALWNRLWGPQAEGSMTKRRLRGAHWCAIRGNAGMYSVSSNYLGLTLQES